MDIRLIKSAQVGAIIRDDVVQGLHLRVFANRKSFYLYFRTKDGMERRPKIGDWPTVAIPDARKVAKEMLLEVAQGKDPIAERKSLREAPRCLDAWEQYKVEHLPKKKSSRDDIARWDGCVSDKFKAIRVADVDYNDVYALHQKLKDTPYQANRTLALISKLMNLCEKWGYRPTGSNPCRHVEKFKEQKRRRYMTAEEAMKISAALHRERAVAPASVAFIYLLILTGARCGEIASAKWSQLIDNKLVLQEHKTDSQGHDRVIHLPAVAMDIIEKLPRTNATITGILSPKKIWERIRKEAGCPDLRLHDLRHSFASVAVSAGYTLAQIGELLGHSSPATTARYAHLMEDAASAAAQDVADQITSRMAPKLRVVS